MDVQLPLHRFHLTQYFRSINDSHINPSSVVARRVIGFNIPTAQPSSSEEAPSTTSDQLWQRKQRAPSRARSGLQELLSAARTGDDNNNIANCNTPELQIAVITKDTASQAQQIIQHTKAATASIASRHMLENATAIGFAAMSELQILSVNDLKKSLRCAPSTESNACHRNFARDCLFLVHDPSPTTAHNSLPSSFSTEFLDSCYLCRCRLAHGHDVFMYK